MPGTASGELGEQQAGVLGNQQDGLCGCGTVWRLGERLLQALEMSRKFTECDRRPAEDFHRGCDLVLSMSESCVDTISGV